ncbi:YbaB/EbfC family nucleoid-associated protein [bacterium]|nr:YbaB/EbfC family nucleoid-associated protein [bacterium]
MFGKDFMKKLQQAQEAFGHLDEKAASIEVEYSAGGGMVSVVMNGKKEIIDLKILPDVVDPNDVEMLQDLIIAAIRGASEKADDEIKSQMSEITGELGIDIPNMPTG